MNQKVFIDISPPTGYVCCQNCAYFDKFGVHLGWCSIKDKHKWDSKKCKSFEKTKIP